MVESSTPREINHWLIRIKDGKNFKNGKYSIWGVKRGFNNSIKGVVNKINSGDILWFVTSKPFGGNIIGMAEYIGYYDRKDEPLLKIHTLTNEEQGWTGNDDWDIQLNFKNFYDTTKQDFKVCISHCAVIFKINNDFKEKHNINIDFDLHYKNYKFYAEPCNKYIIV